MSFTTVVGSLTSHAVLAVDVRPQSHKAHHHVLVTTASSQMQGSSALRVPGCHIRPQLDQALCHRDEAGPVLLHAVQLQRLCVFQQGLVAKLLAGVYVRLAACMWTYTVLAYICGACRLL